MAWFDTYGLESLDLTFREIAEIPLDVQEKILNAQADVVVEAQRESAKAYGVEDTGLMIDKIKKTGVKFRKDGSYVIHVYPQGKRKRGNLSTPNTEIGFENEFGKKGQEARPWMQTANERCAEETTAAGAAVLDEWYKSLDL